MKRTVLLILALWVGLQSHGLADEIKAKPVKVDTEKEKYIREAIQVTGIVDMDEKILDSLVDWLKRENPRIKPSYWAQYRKYLKADSLIQRIIPVYDQYYSTEELKGMIDFYKSPLGQKVLATLPKFTQDCWVVERLWAKDQLDQFNGKLFGKNKN